MGTNKTTRTAYNKRYYQEHREVLRQYQRDRREQFGRPDADKRRDRIYGLAPGEYDQRLAEQQGVCAICYRPEKAIHKSGTLRRLSVDHDHVTGRVRGLLCTACNRGIGYLQHDPQLIEGAKLYVERSA